MAPVREREATHLSLRLQGHYSPRRWRSCVIGFAPRSAQHCGHVALATPFAFRNARWLRPILVFAVVIAGLPNATGHPVATILGHTVECGAFRAPPASRFTRFCNCSERSAYRATDSVLILWQVRGRKLLSGSRIWDNFGTVSS